MVTGCPQEVAQPQPGAFDGWGLENWPSSPTGNCQDRKGLSSLKMEEETSKAAPGGFYAGWAEVRPA